MRRVLLHCRPGLRHPFLPSGVHSHELQGGPYTQDLVTFGDNRTSNDTSLKELPPCRFQTGFVFRTTERVLVVKMFGQKLSTLKKKIKGFCHPVVGRPSPLLFFFKFINFERQRAGEVQERERERARTPSRVCADGAEPDEGLKPTNRETMT